MLEGLVQDQNIKINEIDLEQKLEIESVPLVLSWLNTDMLDVSKPLDFFNLFITDNLIDTKSSWCNKLKAMLQMKKHYDPCLFVIATGVK